MLKRLWLHKHLDDLTAVFYPREMAAVEKIRGPGGYTRHGAPRPAPSSCRISTPRTISCPLSEQLKTWTRMSSSVNREGRGYRSNTVHTKACRRKKIELGPKTAPLHGRGASSWGCADNHRPSGTHRPHGQASERNRSALYA